MQGFDLDLLRTFVAAVEAGSLTAAAPRRFLSQSSLSEQLRKLEAHAGQALLLRSKSGVVPTAAGDRLLVHARRILALSDAAWRDMQGAPLAGELRLAITDYFRPGELAQMLARLGAQHPQVRLRVHIDKSDAIEAAYARGDFDVAVTMRIAAAASGPAVGQVLRREPLVWTGARHLGLRDDAPLRLIVLPETCALRRFAVALLEKRHRPYFIAHEASGVAGVQSAVAAGLGVACLNASSLSADLVPLPRQPGLPALPQVVFRVLPPRDGEQALTTAARQLIADSFRP